jgi:hypothetical protein
LTNLTTGSRGSLSLLGLNLTASYPAVSLLPEHDLPGKVPRISEMEPGKVLRTCGKASGKEPRMSGIEPGPVLLSPSS